MSQAIEKITCERCLREVQNWVHVTYFDPRTHEPSPHDFCFRCWMTSENAPDDDEEIDIEAWRPIKPVQE